MARAHVGAELDLTWIGGVALALATGAGGLAIAFRLPVWLRAGERVVIGLVASVVAVDLAAYVAAGWLGVNLTLVIFTAGLAAALAISLFGVRASSGRLRAALLSGAVMVREQRSARRLLLTVVVLGAALAFLFGRAIVDTPGGLLAHYNNVWSDWSFHASYATTFVYGQNLPPENPLFAGTPFRYTFAPDFLSALLMAGGWSLPAALIWPGWGMTMLALAGLILFARRLTGGLAAGVVAATLTLLGGGLGFWYFLGDAARVGLVTAIAHGPHTYDRFDPPVNIQWYNPILSYYLPQRSFVFGAAILMAILLLLTPAVQSTPLFGWRAAVSEIGDGTLWRRRSETGALLLAGLLAGALPWFHVHTLVVLGIVSLSWAVFYPRAAWLAFGLPVLVFAVPRLLLAVPGDPSAPASLHYPRIQIGWLSDRDNPAWFWIKNTGLFWPLLLAALLSPLALPRRSRALLAPFLLVFLAANLIIFQPWVWDNTKVLVFWYMAASIPVGALLVRLWKLGVAGRVGAAIAWLSLVASGVLSLLGSLPPLGETFTWFTAEEVRLAAEVRRQTPPHAVFLTGDRPNNPVADLAGRSVLMSYRGWLWTYGIDYRVRESDIAHMYAGDDRALALLHRYHVAFVVVGPDELSTWHANAGYFDSRFEPLIRTDSYTVYRVPQP